jgi:hypothetical protein
MRLSAATVLRMRMHRVETGLRQQVKRGWGWTLQRQVWKQHDDQVMTLDLKTRMGVEKDMELSSARWLVLSDQPHD